MGAKTSWHLDEDLQMVSNAATVQIKTLRSRRQVLRYNFPLWTSDEEAMLGVHNVKPFLKSYRDCGGNNIKPICSIIKEEGKSELYQCQKILIFNSECCQSHCCKWCKEHYIMQEHSHVGNSALHLGHSLGGQDLDEALLDIKY